MKRNRRKATADIRVGADRKGRGDGGRGPTTVGFAHRAPAEWYIALEMFEIERSEGKTTDPAQLQLLRDSYNAYELKLMRLTGSPDYRRFLGGGK